MADSATCLDAVIRPYERSHLADVLQVWREATRIAHPFLSDAFISQEAHAIRDKHLPAADTWVWETDGNVAGFLSLLGNEIGGLFVRPAAHRRGIGAALVDHALTLHRSLEVEVFARNEIGRAFYARRGFTLIGEGFDERASEPVLRLQLVGPTVLPGTHQRSDGRG